jgi:hypothetical protein
VDEPIEKFIEVIKRDGGCICTNYVTPEEVAQANAEVKPFLDADKPWQVSCISPCNDSLTDTIRASYSLPKHDAATASYGEVQPVARNSS